MDQKLKEAVSKITNLNINEIKEDMSGDNTPELDSMNQIMLVSEVENEYDIKFTMNELLKVKTLKDIQDLINSKK